MVFFFRLLEAFITEALPPAERFGFFAKMSFPLVLLEVLLHNSCPSRSSPTRHLSFSKLHHTTLLRVSFSLFLFEDVLHDTCHSWRCPFEHLSFLYSSLVIYLSSFLSYSLVYVAFLFYSLSWVVKSQLNCYSKIITLYRDMHACLTRWGNLLYFCGRHL